MRFSVLAAITAFSAIASAQTIADLPTCAQACISNTLSTTGCQQLDINCICHSTDWINSLSCCIAGGCSAADATTTAQFAANLCTAVGVTNLPTTASCSNGTAAVNSTTTTNTTAASASPVTTNAAGQNVINFGLAAAGIAAALL